MNKLFIKYVRKLYKQYEIYHYPNGLYIFKELIGTDFDNINLLNTLQEETES